MGESGSGKSTFAKILTGLEVATGGTVELGGRDIASTPVRARDASLLRTFQMVFQNPDGTLNPSYSVGYAIARALRRAKVARDRTTAAQQVRALLDLVRLAASIAQRRPHQLSGGQKQRVSIARALASEPSVLVCDEPVSALDVSVQAAIVNLLLEIQRKYDTTLLLISHDLGLVRYLADHVVVLYRGRMVERGSAEQVFAPPYHPYTEALLSAVPVPDPDQPRRRIPLRTDESGNEDGERGCCFAGRCPRYLGEVCNSTTPPEQQTPDGHRIRCHIPRLVLAEQQREPAPRDTS